jgi:anti-anti-sigma factor
MVDWLAGLFEFGLGEASAPTGDRSIGAKRPTSKKSNELKAGWGRLRVNRLGPITVARVIVSELIKEPAVSETIEELLALVSAGCDRLVVNLCEVERVTSPFVATLAEAHRRCRGVPGGELRLCGIRPEIRPIFRLTSLDRELRLFDDEPTAVSTAWPNNCPRPLPLGLLVPLTEREEDPLPEMIETRAAGTATLEARQPSLGLRIDVGPRRGTVLNVRQAPWTIGRDESCRLRCLTDVVSRIHAQIEPDGQLGWQIRDLGSRNGTLVNDAVIEGLCRLVDGDRIRIGPLMCTVLLGPPTPSQPPAMGAELANWLRDPTGNGDDATPGGVTRVESSTPTAEVPATAIRISRIQDVQVVAPRVGELLDERSAEQLQEALEEIRLEQPNARVVVDLSLVSAIGSRALGVVLAYALKLARAGGAMRLAHPRPPVRTRLELLRVPEIVPLFDTLDEGVVAVWG